MYAVCRRRRDRPGPHRRAPSPSPTDSRGIHRRISQPEVEHLDAPAGVNHHISRLEVAVNDTLFVRVTRWPRRSGCRRSSAWSEVEPAARRKEFRQRPPLHVLHDDERHAVLLADLVDHRNAGVIQRRRRAGFAEDAGARGGVGLLEDLDGDRPVQALRRAPGTRRQTRRSQGAPRRGNGRGVSPIIGGKPRQSYMRRLLTGQGERDSPQG
jgi:hypothetical protein